MSAKITRLRIAGFKSFADPATIDILPGLTGIVGPNGCGKSNVVEALRWAMGESSARALRGGELDDLVFAGTSARPARSLAEVTLWLDDATGLAPPPFTEADGLEICRRAERGSGSEFRLNGRALRARDITTLFADLSSGARSSSIVSQNRVSALISSKPEDRRSLLEEAAGITGIHARRHDAELKLRQAEGNMERSDDLRRQIGARLDLLEAQSVQARAYRGLSDRIRDDERSLAYLIHTRAEALVSQTETQLLAVQTEHENATAAAAHAKTESETRKSLMASLRERADTLKTHRNRLALLHETAETNRARAETTLIALTDRLARADDDAHRTRLQVEETQAHGVRLDDEIATLDTLLSRLPEESDNAGRAAALHEHALSNAVIQRQDAAARRVEARMQAQSCRAEHDAATSRLETLRLEHETLVQGLLSLRADLPEDDTLALHEDAVRTAGQVLAETRTRHDALARTAQEQGLALAHAEQLLERMTQDCMRASREETRLKQRIAHLVAQTDTTGKELEALRASRLTTDALATLNDQAEAARLEAERLREEVGQHRHFLTNAEQEALRAEADCRTIGQQRDLLEKDIAQGQEVRTRLAERLLDLEKEQNRLMQDAPEKEQIAALVRMRQEAAADVETRRIELASQETQRAALHAEQTDLEDRVRIAATELIHLRARYEALSDTRSQETLPNPVIETLSVPDELGRAVAALLSETVEASLDENATRMWHVLPDLPALPLPPVAQPLNRLIAPPPALARLFAYTGLVKSGSEGDTLQPDLKPGQCLVALDGAFWRWDGYREAGNLPSRALVRIERQSERRNLAARIVECESISAPLEDRLVHVKDALGVVSGRTALLREELQTRESILAQCEQDETRILAQQEQCLARLERVDETRIGTKQDCASVDQRLTDARTALAALPDLSHLTRNATAARIRCDRARAAEKQALDRASCSETHYRETRDTATNAHLQDKAHADREITLSARIIQTRQDLSTHTDELNALGLHALTARKTELEETTRTAYESLARTKADLHVADEALATGERDADRARQKLQELKTVRLRLQSRIEALTPQERNLARAVDAAEYACAALGPVPDPEPAETAFREADALEGRLRREYASLQDRHRTLETELTRHRQSHDALVLRRTETATLLTNRSQDLERAVARAEEARREHDNALTACQDLANAAGSETAALFEAQSACEAAVAELDTCETALKALEIRYSQDLQRAAAAHETAIRLQERLDQARVQRDKLESQRPTDLPRSLDIALTEQSEAALRRRLSRSMKEREALGAVNLLAESEYEDARAQSDHLAREHDELTSAIQRLRGSINELKKEGRERLQAVFTEVDGHFQSLFSRMFNGGRAHLGLVGSDDPLEAGLELFAQPPGKKLTTLSLLSGGEQALTALSLIFATFRCQPAPLCILDEVDAPLDDANVERLCGLLRDITAESGTRFLIVTHHQLTMAHMDRLFGITMQERGVSQVLSVDLQRAASFVENGILPVAS